MAGLPWFALASDFPTHPKTVRLALRLKDQNAGMYVVRLLAFCAQHAPAGRLDGEAVEAIIEGACEWRKTSGALVTALVGCGFLERDGDGYLVHGWLERNGAHVRKRERDAKNPRGNRPRPALDGSGTDAGPALEREKERDRDKKPHAACASADAPPPDDVPSDHLTPGTEDPARDPAGTSRARPAARAESSEAATSPLDDEPHRRLVLEDATGTPPAAPSWPWLAAFRRALADRCVVDPDYFRIASPDDVRDVRDQLEAELARLRDTARAVEIAYPIALREKRKTRKWPVYLKLYRGPLSDAIGDGGEPTTTAPVPADAPPAFAAMVRHAAETIASEPFRRDLAALHAQQVGDVLRLAPVDEFHATRMRDLYGDALEQLAAAAAPGVHVELTEAA
jgi:hypothetical protein